MIQPPQRTAFSHVHPILTRAQDNDANGHIAGSTVHAYFETAIQAFLIEQAGLDLRDGEAGRAHRRCLWRPVLRIRHRQPQVAPPHSPSYISGSSPL